MQDPNTLYLHQYNLTALPDVLPCELTEYETQKSLRLPKQQREHYLHTRYLLRNILQQHGLSPNDLYYSSTGQPLLHSALSISLSHSQSIWLIAIMKTESIGIDIQTSLPKNKPALLARFNLPDTLSDTSFLKHWTLTESYCKCMQLPLLSTLSQPIEDQINTQNLFITTRTEPFMFSTVSTSKVKNIIFLPLKKCT